MKLFLLVLFACAAFSNAIPIDTDIPVEIEIPVESIDKFTDQDIILVPEVLIRKARQAQWSNNQPFNIPPTPKPLPFQIQSSGGGNRRDGFNLNLDTKVKAWESPNKRHEIFGTGGYSQRFGGQFGSSQPNFRGGAGYVFHF